MRVANGTICLLFGIQIPIDEKRKTIIDGLDEIEIPLSIILV